MDRSRPFVSAVCIGSIVASLASAQPPPQRWLAKFPPALGPERSGAAVCVWMSDRLGAFALEDGIDALRVERVEPLPGGGSRVLIRQLWHGLPVLGADARAIVDADGRLTSLITGFAPGLRAPLEPRITPDGAGALAARAGALAGVPAEGVTLAVARRADGDHLVLDVVHRRAGGEPVRSVVDAVTGEVLEVDAGVAHAVGRVYPTDPRQPLEERELPDLLAGPPLRARDFGIDDALYPAAVPHAPGDFRYAPADPEFDQVNTYWHVAHILGDFFGPLGYAGPPDSLIVRVHFPLDPEPARTIDNYVTFGLPIPTYCREPSLSHDIVYHELGHAVMYGFGIQPGGVRREASALHEGLADYFAAAFTGDPAIGEWLYLGFPAGATRVDQPSPPWDYAHYDRVAFGAGGLASQHANGMILSSGLWDLRQRIGSTCDSLVLEAFTYLPTVPTWAQFADGLFLADQDHHGGRFWPEIGAVLSQRKIRGTVAAAIAGPSTPLPGKTVEFRALPCCGGTPGHYHWRVRTWCRGMPCEAWRDLADGPDLTTSFTEDSELELSVLSPFGDADTAYKHVSVREPLLRIQGPTRVVKNTVATWNVRLVASAPWVVTLYRQWLVPGGYLESLGQRTSVAFPVEAPVRLTAQLSDARGRSAIAQLDVETFIDKPPAASSKPVSLTQQVDGSGRAETLVQVAQATSLRVGVYDLHGRERVLLVDDHQPRGARVVRWDTHVLEPGIYFARAVTAAGQVADLRFLVIR